MQRLASSVQDAEDKKQATPEAGNTSNLINTSSRHICCKLPVQLQCLRALSSPDAAWQDSMLPAGYLKGFQGQEIRYFDKCELKLEPAQKSMPGRGAWRTLDKDGQQRMNA